MVVGKEADVMGLFDKLTEKKDRTAAKQEGCVPQSEKMIQHMLAEAEMYLDSGMPERAFGAYRHIVELTPNVTAQYNLGSLYAQGKGTERDFLQAAYWFRQAALSGDASAEKLLTKSTMDYLEQDLSRITPYELHQKMQRYTQLLYPKENGNRAAETLYALAGHHFNKKEYAGAAKLFRAAAEYYNHGEAQNYLAVLYNAGAGLEQNDLAALYWFDRAADNGVEASKKDRDGILNAYFTNNSPKEFFDIMETLVKTCVNGTSDIPQDNEKAQYWRRECEKLLKGSL